MVVPAVELSAVIQDLVAELERAIRVDAVVLYGSYANGIPHLGSDIDVAVVSPDFEGMSGWKRQELLGSLSVHANPWISPIGYSTSEYANVQPQTFLSEIVRTGKVVYQAPEREVA